MKSLNNAERKAYKLKFIGMYSISIVLIIIILCGFLQPAPSIKTIMSKNEKSINVITKTVYLKKNIAENNFHEIDSLKAIISFNQKKIDESDSFIHVQQDTIIELQKQCAITSKTLINNKPDKNTLAKLKKQNEFLDWALRSQIAVTHTLTKENNDLKYRVTKIKKGN